MVSIFSYPLLRRTLAMLVVRLASNRSSPLTERCVNRKKIRNGGEPVRYTRWAAPRYSQFQGPQGAEPKSEWRADLNPSYPSPNFGGNQYQTEAQAQSKENQFPTRPY